MKIDKISHATAAFLLAMSFSSLLAYAQAPAKPQTESIADAARRAREQSKNRQAGKVITNEDVPNIKGTISVVGTPPPEPAAAQPNAQATAAPGAPGGAEKSGAAAAKPEVKDEAYWRKQFAGARRTLADDSKELDVLQREYKLKEQQFYLDPNVALREQYGRTDLNKTQDDINAKKADVEKDQQAISTLEDQLRQAGGDAVWSREPNSPATTN